MRPKEYRCVRRRKKKEERIEASANKRGVRRRGGLACEPLASCFGVDSDGAAGGGIERALGG